VNKQKDLTGETFGKLLVIGLTTLKKFKGNRNWACQCSCMNLTICKTEHLTYLGKVDCGCGNKQRKSDGAVTHGCSIKNNKLYSIYKAMMDRCYNKYNKEYSNYGGRGIEVCERWHDVSLFFEDMEGAYSNDLSLDREDFNGNYCPENCSWRTLDWQAYNKRQHSKNTSSKSGVSFDKDRNKWAAYISQNNKRIALGRFELFEDAVAAREQAELKYFGRLKGN
jgi:hypothetical protein